VGKTPPLGPQSLTSPPVNKEKGEERFKFAGKTDGKIFGAFLNPLY